ncbi:MAG: hypothetical protein GY832_35705 [Chloroflexi bacterium]|nr:hypothetical protein [Chloroflexota bacterium]
MPWTTWIDIVQNPAETEKDVQDLYKRTRNSKTGQVPDTVRLNSLTPQVAGLLDELSRAIQRNATGLKPREKEIAALVTSVLNGCVH